MGYLCNHLATVICAIFAGVLSALWAAMVPTYPVLHPVFVMAVPITWFMVLTCWLAQKSTDYMHSPHHDEKPQTPSRAAL